MFFDGQKTDYFVDDAEWRRFDAGMRRLLRDRRFVASFCRRAKSFLEKKGATIGRACRRDYSCLSDAQVARAFSAIRADVDAFYTRMWMVFLLGEPLAQAVHTLLLARVPQNADEWVRDFASPLEPNDAVNARISLLRIAASPVSGRASLLTRHARRFSHLSVFDVGQPRLSSAHFFGELSRIKQAGAELAHIRAGFSARRRVFRSRLHALTLSPNGLEHALVRMLSDAVFLRDYRDSLRLNMNVALRHLYAEIGRRLGLSVSDVTLLSDAEITDALLGRLSRKRLSFWVRERRSAFLFRLDGEKAFVASGARAKRQSRSLYARQKTAAFVHGRCGSPGTA
ncbi:MAG: hypothetical protein Q8P02_04640, partial [Candidatus Micrarchaeota archaeon]|nr:hypothetical protein [Candidatus Micrarchaeota archaeon]